MERTADEGGMDVLPNIIFERQQALGLDAIDVNIILHIASYWWAKESKPHPSKKTIATAMGIEPRTVQRRIARALKRPSLSDASSAAAPAMSVKPMCITWTG